ncbi:MAG TPA: copper chaperone PCu(A)C [Thermodesulfobacteriota bacterium]|nr:copper chaperone PCu(A)C [Thermodesulfobacteriota bacterium]
MRKYIFALALLFILTPLSYAQNKVYVSDMRIGEAPSGSSSIPVYLNIGNPGESDAKLVKVSSVMADKVALYAPKAGGGKGEVVEADSLTVPAGGSLVLKPGGPYILLEGLKASIADIDGIELFLKFENARNAIVTVPTRDLGKEKTPFDN